MSDLQIEEAVEQRPDFTPSDGKDSFCHISDGSGRRFYCGKLNPTGEHPCGEYRGEMTCSRCGNVTCPRCAVIAGLDERIEDADVQ